MELYLIRHGQTDWNKERRAQGQSESKLTELGEQQARELGERLAPVEFDHIYCSSSQRTRQTADLAFGHRNMEIEYRDSLREIFLGPWEGHLYDDIRLVRVVVYIALSLVIAVACFNIVSSLVMAVKEKQASIAILKTMGATDSQIRNTFVFQGLLNGFIGVFWGTLLAVITAPNLSLIVGKLEGLLGIKVLSGDIYFIDFLPSQLQANDVLLTVLVAIVLSVLATLYPAQKAAAIQPARALH